MGTRSHIGILHKNGSIEAVFCHWDGYLSGNGVILFANYNTLDKVRELISKGSFSSLGYTVEKTDYYNEPDWDVPWEYPNPMDYLKGYKNKDFFDIEYSYLFDENSNQWLVAEYPESMSEYVSLEDRLDKINVKNLDEDYEYPISWKEFIQCFQRRQENIVNYLISKGIDKTKEQLIEEMKVFSYDITSYIKEYYKDVILPQQDTSAGLEMK